MGRSLNRVYSRDKASWSLSLPVRIDNSPYWFTPQSDFFLSFHLIVCFIAGVESTVSDKDEARMILQGASIVRMVNRQLSKAGHKQDFILMALYLNNSSHLTRYLLYQNQNHDV